MKYRLISIIALILSTVMLLSALSACTDLGNNSENESDINYESGSGLESDPSDENESETVLQGPLLEGKHAALIENADDLSNKVQAYFTDSARTHFAIENTEMKLIYAVEAALDKQVSTLTDKRGNPYISNTMDVFVQTTDGSTYFASPSSVGAKTNIYRMGYYFYETRFESQDFCGSLNVKSEKLLKHVDVMQANQIEILSKKDSILKLQLKDTKDPFVFFNRINYAADKYQYLEITLKADEKAESNMQLFLTAGSQERYNSKQRTSFAIKTDGEYYTYRIPLYGIYDYTGTVSDIRLDFSGAVGATFEISSMKLLEVELTDLPYSLGLNRSFMTYSNKNHHVIQIATTETVTNIANVGMKTVIDASTVDKLVAVDENGICYSLEEVDWSTAHSVAFDIKGAGIFGYILPFDGSGGTLKVTEENGKYIIIQTSSPENNTIEPSVYGMNNANDFYMGQRIYTDANHSFDEFLHEVECERNPLSSSNIKVDDTSAESKYLGYDALRGIYTFSVSGSEFNSSYYNTPQKHYNVDFAIRGDSLERKIYVMTQTKSGCLESAVLLDEDQLMIPIPLEVGKNFSEPNGERNLYNQDDAEYGEVIFPMVIEPRVKYEYSVVNLYQMWGKYPLKQISWIQYGAPYYHLSTGVTETNCIRPYYGTKNGRDSLTILPDFRSMSAPFWSDQPQHNSCGSHIFLSYIDADGKSVNSELQDQVVGSYGPIYADMTMNYISDDGKIKVTYNHLEMPQTDENRTYYQMKYEVLADVSIADFSRDFSFYSTNSSDPKGVYQQVGYLDDSNTSQVVDAVAKGGETVKYTLGDNCPYFSFFNMDNPTSESQQGYANVAFLVHSSEFIIEGKEQTPNFVLINSPGWLSISLDLGEVTLKAGDTFTINAILLPWGSQESVYDGSNGKAPDQNVRDVRENTMLTPLKATAVSGCEVIDSVYLPMLRSNDGKSAEFIISGGENNVALRIYGFDMLTCPEIEEKIGDEWVKYEVCSANSPDGKGYAHYYDGYGVYYDGDGTFSYAFIVTMNEGVPRHFRIKADKEFDSYPKLDQPEGGDDLIDLYIDPNELFEKVDLDFVSDAEVLSEDGTEFIRIYGGGDECAHAAAYIHAYRANTDKVTGQYIVLKYRYPTTNQKKVDMLSFFTSTATISAAESHRLKITSFDQDGEWHVMVIDMSKAGKDSFVAADDGSFYAKYLRLVFFDKRMPTDSYVDIAYFGMADTVEEILEINQDFERINLIEGNNEYFVYTADGKKVSALPIPEEGLVLPESIYSVSTLKYSSYFDGISGISVAAGGNSVKGEHIFKYNASAIADIDVENYAKVEGSNMVFAGWAVVESGIEKYVWSADNGLTWHDAELFGKQSIGKAGTEVLAAAGKAISYEFTEADNANGNFQGHNTSTPKGLSADLSEYSGCTVNIIFAAKPAGEENTVCPLVYVINVKVP